MHTAVWRSFQLPTSARGPNRGAQGAVWRSFELPTSVGEGEPLEGRGAGWDRQASGASSSSTLMPSAPSLPGMSS